MSNYLTLPNGQLGQYAVYHKQAVPDYQENPLIEALPLQLSPVEAALKLHIKPTFNQVERELDVRDRLHCIPRLQTFYYPTNQSVDLEQRVSLTLRQGYTCRNPINTEYIANLRDGKVPDCFKYPRPGGFTILGPSGTGKSRALERVLSQYPQVIVHREYQGYQFSHLQIPYLFLQCPHDGSIKGLCIKFFTEIDKLLGTRYQEKFGSSRLSAASMVPRMEQVSKLHSLGMLIIDEVQNLSRAKSGGSEEMLNFFVSLTNEVGIPIILVGTNAAEPILSADFKQARRACGNQGAVYWERLNEGKEFKSIIDALQQFQWTKQEIEYDDRIVHVLYEESQGILDILIKLIIMAQMRAVVLNKKSITPEIILKVAKDNLKLIRPMLEALKSGNREAIEKYDDLLPLNITEFIEQQYHKTIVEPQFSVEMSKDVNNENTDIMIDIFKILVDTGTEEHRALEAAKMAVADSKATDKRTALQIALQLLSQDITEEPAEIPPKSRNKGKSTKEKINLLLDEVRKAKEEKLSGHDALLRAGFVKPFLTDQELMGGKAVAGIFSDSISG